MDFEDEPMDIDLSGNSTRHTDAMDISYTDDYPVLKMKIKEEPLEIKKEPLEIKEEPLELKEKFLEVKEKFLEVKNEDIQENIVDNEIHITPTVIKRTSLRRKDHKKMSNWTLSIIFSIMSLVTLLIYHIYTFECSKELDLEVLKKSLAKNVIGQSLAIKNIIGSLEEESSNKILLLYGGTGVGKTLTVSLILQNHYHYANIYHYTMPSFIETFSTDLMLGLTFCPSSLIVVDDLNSTDMYVKDHIKKLIEKSENLNKNITIILVFNCDTINEQYIKKCDYSFRTNLEKTFKEIRTLTRFIKFNSLSEEHLMQCIKKELGGKMLSDGEFENIIKNFNVTVDGCKGVYKKMKLLNIN